MNPTPVPVSGLERQTLQLSDGTTVEADIVIWSIGQKSAGIDIVRVDSMAKGWLDRTPDISVGGAEEKPLSMPCKSSGNPPEGR